MNRLIEPRAVPFLRLVYRCRWHSRQHCRHVRLFEHPQHLCQTDHRRARRFTGRVFADPNIRNRHCGAGGTAARVTDRPLRRPGRARAWRAHGRCRPFPFRASTEFLAIRLGTLLARNRRRSAPRFARHQRHDCAVVRAQTRPGDGHCQPRNRNSEIHHPPARRVPICAHRLARHLDGFRNGRASAGGGSSSYLRAAKPGRHRPLSGR